MVSFWNMEPSRANALCILAHHRNLVTITLGTVCQLCGSSRFRILPEWPVGAHSGALFNRRSAGLPRASWCSPSSETISNAPGTNQSVNKANAAPSTHRDSERSIGGSSNVGCWSGSAQVELPHMRIRRSALGDDFSADACFDSDRDSGVSRPAGRLDASCLLSRLIAVSASALLLRGRALFCSQLLIDSPETPMSPPRLSTVIPRGQDVRSLQLLLQLVRVIPAHRLVLADIALILTPSRLTLPNGGISMVHPEIRICCQR